MLVSTSCRILRVTTDGLTDEQERLPPVAAVTKFNERAKRIGKVNTEIADWLQVRFRGFATAEYLHPSRNAGRSRKHMSRVSRSLPGGHYKK